MTVPPERSTGPRRPVKVVLIALGVALLGLPLLMRVFLIEAFQMPSGSMIPTLLVGDHIFVNKTVSRPERGDVIVFKYPLDPKVSYVKRVVGLPGDTVAIVHNELQINGKPVPRRDLGENDAGEPGRRAQAWEEHTGKHTYSILQEPGRSAEFGPVQVAADSYFVMGDNRDNSNDSRVWGTVAGNLIQGRVMVVWFSSPPRGDMRWDRVGHRVD
jgi:signal peptidase I